MRALRVAPLAILIFASSGCLSGGDGASKGSSVNPGVLPVPQSNGPTESLPDLTVDKDMLSSSVSLEQEYRPTTYPDGTQDCAVVEGCIVGDQTRKVLKFNVGVMNVGPVDVQIGNPADDPSDFEWSDCHQHYHFKGFAEYTLSDSSGVVAVGAKRAFCLMDIQHWSPDSGPNQGQYDCSTQGISVGWEDVYDKSLDCQWVDVTDVPPGNYTLSVTVNAQHRIAEKGDAPNTVSVPVTVQ